jgi:ribosomal protein S18 acetylase RimI-like enzyme
MVMIKRVTDFAELNGIKKLQEDNLKKNLSDNEAASEGFVTAEYSIEFLEMLHQGSPSVIAKDGNLVVGYALAAVKSIREHHDLLSDLFNGIDKIKYNGQLLKDCNYVVVGQLCVARNYRGQGLVQQMYQYFRISLAGEFDFCVTDVAETNPRSLKAHIKTGFQVVATLSYGGMGWSIVLWDWKNTLPSIAYI